ncbi:cytochrome P450 [Sporormia fimetaria CBS 119925]|uniref:Cytochrome P450 n=1 Tax=Sporormia fimetaria CBS 119925 TaxID=1340428 RepID=A0A6A6V7I8_9PLEO|nr:cytochrome P450 [Sporormia fimetaria CBS 119925]
MAVSDFARRLSGAANDASLSRSLVILVTILLTRWVIRGIYRVYFHPLSRFPGPKLWAFTRTPQLLAIWKGRLHEEAVRLHSRYGDVVRISPDELSFSSPDAWRDIYGHAPKMTRGKPPPKHWERYGRPINGVQNLIGTPTDREHAQMRKIFSPAFSDRALKQQEPLFLRYADKLVGVLRERLAEDPSRKFEMVRMYNFTTFDVMGDLTFGESLHMLDNAQYDPWVSIMFASVRVATRISIFLRYPIIAWMFKRVIPRSLEKKQMDHFQHSVDRVTKRLEKGRSSEGVDLWDLILDQKEGHGLSRAQMDSNSSLFMVAGTETTASLLSGLTYLLLKNPTTMEKLVEELRATFASEADMSLEAIAALPYLNACIKEALRLYPPVAPGLPHLTPREGSTICGEYVPPGITVGAPHYAMYRSEKLFKDPHAFIPNRWLGDEKYADDQRNAVQPFSVGSRDCLGRNMAYHEMRLIMTKVLYNFDMELCPESEDWINQRTYILWDKKPLMVTLKDVRAS